MRSSRRLAVRRCAAALIASALAACGGDDPAKQVESLDSWRATAEMATTAVRLGHVTPRYARQIRDRATATLNEAREKPTPGATAQQRRELDAAERRLASAVDTLDTAVRP
jgi:hypothetical protein